ncbi:MAG TPA: cytochrome c oxidase subunit II [Bacteroidales bacterium]|nr:cytochrome c oxidase subunit II [Bacteroidales bacterium]HPM93693.1 cytochrome c oxidase subunit II [Bacteroidales bacterium]
MSGASNFVHGVDLTFIIILGISLFFLVGITAVMIYFVIRYSRKRNPKATNIEGNTKLEILWTVIPLILVLVMFWFGWVGYQPMRKVPEGAIPVKAIGQMWSWSFEYPNGKKSAELVVPLNKPVKLDLFSRDVLHSLYIPAFRIKEDVVPGKNNYMWFTALELGEYDLYCAEYCGERHSYMLSKVKVLPEAEYESWLVQSDIPADEHPGLSVLKQNGCIACHSLDGSKIVGPSFKGIYGHEVEVITDGKERKIIVDDEYILKSIYEPNADVVKGFNPGLMISYKEQLKEEDVKKIIEYIKGL